MTRFEDTSPAPRFLILLLRLLTFVQWEREISCSLQVNIAPTLFEVIQHGVFIRTILEYYVMVKAKV